MNKLDFRKLTISLFKLFCIGAAVSLSVAVNAAMSSYTPLPTIEIGADAPTSIVQTTYGSRNDGYRLSVEDTGTYSFVITDYAWPDAFDSFGLLVANPLDPIDQASVFSDTTSGDSYRSYFSSRSHSWGADLQSLSVSMLLEAGTDYVMSVFAEFEGYCNCGSSGFGLYGVSITYNDVPPAPVPLPGSLLFLLSGLGSLAYFKKAQRTKS